MAEKRFSGMLELIGDKKFGFVREFRDDLPKGDNDYFVPPTLIEKLNLRDGVPIESTLRPGRKRAMQVARVDSVMGVDADTWQKTRNFDSGQIIYPDEKLNLITRPDDISMRVVDLVAPIGKGQRALIVAPPRTGKTILLKQKIGRAEERRVGKEWRCRREGES